MTPVERKFYKLFWEEPACQAIFLLHKEQLLEKKDIEWGSKKEGYYLDRIVVSNSLKRKKFDTKHLAQRVENHNIELNHALESSIERNFNEDRIEQFIQRYFGKTIEMITTKLEGGPLSRTKFVCEFLRAVTSEKRFLNFLKEHKIVRSEVASLEELGEAFERDLSKEIEKIITPASVRELFDNAEHLSNVYNNQIYNGLLEANGLFTDVFYQKENYNDRLPLLDSLYEAKVIESGINKTYYECVHCEDGVFKGIVTLGVKPSKIMLKCPACSKEVYYMAPYRLNSSIYKHILHKDGILFHAVQYALQEHEIPFACNLSLPPDLEFDIVLQDEQKSMTDIIEVKVNKTDRPFDTQLSNLQTAVTKLIAARNKLIKLYPDKARVRFHLVTNHTDDSLYETAQRNLHEKLNEANLLLYTPQQFKQYLKRRSRYTNVH